MVQDPRPLKRAVQQMIENNLAQALLRGQFHQGSDILVGWENGEIVFR